ncbi:hypothetical protein [Variovorax sp. YR752]|uniref:hypothetical protein n=1 Tax=Variovorax sp. YR752 TaxID=1884383 RepID=UPI000BE43B6C
MVALVAACTLVLAHANDEGTPYKLVLGFPAGGALDVLARSLTLSNAVRQGQRCGQQLLPDAWPAVAAACLGVNGFDMHQQSIVAHLAPLSTAGLASEVLVVSRHADSQHPALHRDRPHPSMTLDEGVLHRCAFAKYAVAFSRMPCSIFTLI